MDKEVTTNTDNLHDAVESETIVKQKEDSEQQAVNETQQETDEGAKSYSQTEVDQIVKEQLSKQKQKYAELFNDSHRNELEEQYIQLKQGQLKLEYDRKVFKCGFPEETTDFLDYSSPEKCEESYQKILSLITKISEKILKSSNFNNPILKKGEDTDLSDNNKEIRKVFNL